MENDFLEFVSAILGVKKSEFSLETAYGTLKEWDSVMHLRLVLEIEQKYGVKYSIEEIPNLMTLGAFYAVVRKKEFLSQMSAALEVDDVSFDTVLADVDGWCSLKAFAVLIQLERKFAVVLPITEFAKCKTIGDVAIAAGIKI